MDAMQHWQQFESDIARIAARLTSDEMLREDLTQEMRIHIWRAPDGRTRSWYLSGARWRAVDFMRRTAIDCPEGDLDRQVIHYGVLGDVDPEVLRIIPADWHELLMTEPLETVPETVTLSLEIHEAMETLTTRQRQIAYTLSQGFTQAEVAEALGISRRTVANELVRIRAALMDARETLYPGRV